MKSSRILLFFIFLALAIVALRENFLEFNHTQMSNNISEQSFNQSKLRIAVPYEGRESWEIPAIVPFSDEQRLYVSEVVEAVIRVMAEASSLGTEEKILGLGQFHWPKNPDEPIKTLKSYFGQNFRMAGIFASFKRESESGPWIKAALTVHPRNFPAGVYLMKISPKLFDQFNLQKVVQEDREEERVKHPIVFYFEHKKIQGFTLKVEARSDVASIHDQFPSSFHAIKVTRN
jgi:hypothetical protein